MSGVELMDREFIAVIKEGRESRASIEQLLDCYQVLDEVGKQFDS